MVYRCGGSHWRTGHGGDCAGWWVTCTCGWSEEYRDEPWARWVADLHERGHQVEDQELERWVDWTLESVAWYKEHADDEQRVSTETIEQVFEATGQPFGKSRFPKREDPYEMS